MDRYIQDIEVGYKNQILRNGRLARRCVVALSPRPRLCLLLANDPHTIWSRKREDPPEEIAQASRWAVCSTRGPNISAPISVRSSRRA